MTDASTNRNTDDRADATTPIDPTQPASPTEPASETESAGPTESTERITLTKAASADQTAPSEPVREPETVVATAAPVSQALGKRRPLFATIFWGALMLAVAAFFAARELVPGGLDLLTWLLAAAVGLGLLLVIAGIAAASRRAG
jgi:hypothetical protein